MKTNSQYSSRSTTCSFNDLFALKLKTLLFCISFPICFWIPSKAQILQGSEANSILNGSSTLRMSDKTSIPEFFRLIDGTEFNKGNFDQWLKTQFEINSDLSLELVKEETGNLGFTHYRFQQTFQSIPIEWTHYYAHTKRGRLNTANGFIYNEVNVNNGQDINETEALEKALEHVNAEVYKWEVPAEEAHIKKEEQNADATYYPNGELVYIEPALRSNQLQLAYKFNIYASKPLYRANVYVNASSGDIIFESNLIHTSDSLGDAETKYSGKNKITTEYTGTHFQLRETGRGNGIETYDLNESTNYGNAVDFLDYDNYWNNVNQEQDEVAGDAHWGTEMTYDYFMLQHGRNSIDNNGFALKSYVHYNSNYANAFWDGQRMTYGDGNSTMDPLTALDITGHEVAHGLTSFTAGLIYQDESGALNESFSDIFGTAIEFYAKPSQANWFCGEDIGIVIRNLSDPKSEGHPDTYQGINWYTGWWDAGGVHTNSGVQNYWFYLLSIGKNGTNDLGNTYNVNGIGLEKAGQIAFRNLTVYLGPNSQYADARFYAIQSAIDLFGNCSPEVQATTDAWFAVGVGSQFDPTLSIQNLTTTPTDIACYGENNGTAQALTTGGQPPYSYNWSNGATGTSISNLIVGTYSVTVTDNYGCISINSFNITEPAELSSNGNTTEASCDNLSDGLIDLTISGGTIPYNFIWSNGSNTEDISGLATGIYVVTVSDENGCLANNSFTIDAISYGPETSNILGLTQAGSYQGTTYSVSQSPGSTYYWEAEGGYIVAGQGSNMVIIKWESPGFGKLTVTETESSGCIGEAVILDIIIEEATGIGNPVATPKIQFYPNPTTNYLTIVTDEPTNIKLYSLLGSLLWEMDISEEQQLNSSDLAKGIYILKATNQEGKSISKKLEKR